MTPTGSAHLRKPRGACDTHCHVIGPRARFPFAPHRQSDPSPDATVDMLGVMHRQLGIERCVVVQSAVHGTDPSVTLNAVAQAPERMRGVVLLEPSAFADIPRIHGAGIRGIRLNLVRRERETERNRQQLQDLGQLLAPFGWHLLLHMSPRQVVELEPVLATLPVPAVIDHLGRVDPSLGLEQPMLAALLRLLGAGHVWVKIAAVDKLSRQPYPHEDICDVAAMLLRAAPRRVIWGSDWPHPDASGLRGGHVPDDQALADLISRYAPDEALQQLLLVDNPAELYGFTG